MYVYWDNLEKAMAPHSSTLAWKIPWTEEPGELQSMGSLGVRHDWATSLSRIGEGNGNPLQCSCLENPKDGAASWATVYGVAQSRTWLKRLSSSSSSSTGKKGKDFQEQRKRNWLYANSLGQMQFGEHDVFLKMFGRWLLKISWDASQSRLKSLFRSVWSRW